MDGGHNLGVRAKDARERTNPQQCCCNIYHIIKKSVRTGKVKLLIRFTEKVRDF
jgi:hypothetical protein